MGAIFDRVFEHGVHAERVDFDKGIVYGAKISGMKSLHGRDYTDRAYENGLSQYEGAIGYRNHAGGSSGRKRDVDDAFCVYHNPRHVPGDGPRADIHILDTEEPFARKFMKAAASDDPAKHRAFSFSHDAQIRTSKDKAGRPAVESIDKVLSVDVVPRGATTRGIWEGYDMVPPVGDDEEDDGKPYHHHVGKAMHAVAVHPTMAPEHKKTITGHLMKALHGTEMNKPLGLGDKGEDTDPEIQAGDKGKESRPKDGGEIEPESGSKGGGFKEGIDMSELEQLRLRERVRKTADSFGVAVDDEFLTTAVQEGYDATVPKIAERLKRQRARDAARPRSLSRQQLQATQAQEAAPDEPSLLKWAPGARARMVRS